MLQQATPLDLAFQALADPARRSMVERLSRGPASVSELARPLDMSLPAGMRHLAMLGAGGGGRPEGGMDFRVGGEDYAVSRPPGELPHHFRSRYHDIVPNERIVYTYWMHHGENLASVSVSTIEVRPEGAKTRLVITEVGVFLDGYYSPEGREDGTRQLMEQIVPIVEG